MAVCGPVRCASAQPLAHCLFAVDLAYSALDREGWRCIGVPGVGLFFTTPPRAVSSPLRTSRLTSRFPFTVSAPPLPPPLFLPPGPPPVDPLPPQVCLRSACHAGVAGRGDQGGGAMGESGATGGDTSKGVLPDLMRTLGKTQLPKEAR
ncbi:unnamed protein product [Closterium sp. NIES-53]